MISKLQPKIFPGHWNPFIKLSNVKGVYLKMISLIFLVLIKIWCYLKRLNGIRYSYMKMVFNSWKIIKTDLFHKRLLKT